MKEKHSIVRYGHQKPIKKKTPIDICTDMRFQFWLISAYRNKILSSMLKKKAKRWFLDETNQFV